MLTRCTDCGRVYDDAELYTLCPHYPIGSGAGSYCKKCDLFKPCLCPAPTAKSVGLR